MQLGRPRTSTRCLRGAPPGTARGSALRSGLRVKLAGARTKGLHLEQHDVTRGLLEAVEDAKLQANRQAMIAGGARSAG